MATQSHTILSYRAAIYGLRVDSRDVVVDATIKGEPGDVVVVWPAKGGPRIMRRLARCAPFDQYYFQTLDDCRTVALLCNKVRLVHAIERLAGVAP